MNGPRILDPVYDESGNLIGKRCRKCRHPLHINDFYRPVNAPIGRSICKRCWALKYEVNYARQSKERKDPAFRAKYILKDTKATDRTRKQTNDLTLEWVQQEIQKGCAYCGETQLRMSLDRIDNNAGHLKTNVVPACIRCNFLRKTMPYAAWLCLVPGLREAREKGLFGTWTGAIERWGGKRMRSGIKKSTKVPFWTDWPKGAPLGSVDPAHT